MFSIAIGNYPTVETDAVLGELQYLPLPDVKGEVCNGNETMGFLFLCSPLLPFQKIPPSPLSKSRIQVISKINLPLVSQSWIYTLSNRLS